jgi:hypothetical protein
MTDKVSPNDTAIQAQGQLDALSSDPAWTERFFAGDVEARRQFGELTAAAALRDDHANALADTPAPDSEWKVYGPNELPARDLATVIQDFRMQGIGDGAISDLLAGRQLPKEEYIAAKQLQHMRLGDAEWVKRFMNGGAAERREATLMAMIIVGYEGPR